jgi:hypothetical protein
MKETEQSEEQEKWQIWFVFDRASSM